MNNKRIEFHHKLEEVLGSTNVYFQPPENLRMQFPAIVYSLSNIQNRFADNTVYQQNTAYNVIMINKNPDNDITYVLSRFKYSSFNNRYVSDGLYHDSFTIYY